MNAISDNSEAPGPFDVVVIGSGPAGCVTSLFLRKYGLRVLMLERQQFPRYHIGESLTGVSGDYIRELDLEADMVGLQFPEKSGVKVIGRGAKSEFFVPVLRPTWQVRRSEFDALLLDRALGAGAVHRLGTVKSVVREPAGAVRGVVYQPEGSEAQVEVRSKFVVDASGQSTVLSRHGVAGPMRMDAFGRQMAVFSQFKGAVRDPGMMGNNTFIFYADTHHWSWFIPISPELVSIGIVIPSTTFKRCGDEPEKVLQWGLANINPDLTRRLAEAQSVESVRVIRNYSYRINPFVGDGWLCVGDAHRFADPIFSFGVAMAMSEARAAADAIHRAVETGSWEQPFADYVAFSNRGQNAAFDLIRYFWKFPAFFGVQARGPMRKDFIRMLAGDLFEPHDIPALAMMRNSLALSPPPNIPEGLPQQLAARVMEQFSDFQGISTALIDWSEQPLQLSFLLSDGGWDLKDALKDFEHRLRSQYGADKVAVRAWIPPEHPGPALDRSQVIFRRSIQ